MLEALEELHEEVAVAESLCETRRQEGTLSEGLMTCSTATISNPRVFVGGINDCRLLNWILKLSFVSCHD